MGISAIAPTRTGPVITKALQEIVHRVLATSPVATVVAEREGRWLLLTKDSTFRGGDGGSRRVPTLLVTRGEFLFTVMAVQSSVEK